MGRSVDYLSRAKAVTFIKYTEDNDESVDYYIAQENWEYFTESLTEVLLECCPSLNIMTGKERRWDGRETSIIADNAFCEIGLSEYCGLVSVSIRVNEHYEPDNKIGLAENWIKRTWPNILKKLTERFTTLRKIGTFSNGEGVYEKTVV